MAKLRAQGIVRKRMEPRIRQRRREMMTRTTMKRQRWISNQYVHLGSRVMYFVDRLYRKPSS